MFNDFIWGGYMEWRLWPEQKGFIDSQSDLTGEATKLYLNVIALGDGWQTALQRYKDSTSIVLRHEGKDSMIWVCKTCHSMMS
jgi:hypothetical protein